MSKFIMLVIKTNKISNPFLHAQYDVSHIIN